MTESTDDDNTNELNVDNNPNTVSSLLWECILNSLYIMQVLRLPIQIVWVYTFIVFIYDVLMYPVWSSMEQTQDRIDVQALVERPYHKRHKLVEGHRGEDRIISLPPDY